jgi:hypothetical protein
MSVVQKGGSMNDSDNATETRYKLVTLFLKSIMVIRKKQDQEFSKRATRLLSDFELDRLYTAWNNYNSCSREFPKHTHDMQMQTIIYGKAFDMAYFVSDVKTKYPEIEGDFPGLDLRTFGGMF